MESVLTREFVLEMQKEWFAWAEIPEAYKLLLLATQEEEEQTENGWESKKS